MRNLRELRACDSGVGSLCILVPHFVENANGWGHPENRHPAFETRVRSLLAVLTGRMQGESLRLRVPAGNRKSPISGRKRSRDAALRMTAVRVERGFQAGFSANIRAVT